MMIIYLPFKPLFIPLNYFIFQIFYIWFLFMQIKQILFTLFIGRSQNV
jgi:hypothetical protein